MSINIKYTPEFIRSYKKQIKPLQEEIEAKILELGNASNHKTLKVHKLHGRLRGYWSFSINYKYRIIFRYVEKNTIAIVTVGDHSIYN